MVVSMPSRSIRAQQASSTHQCEYVANSFIRGGHTQLFFESATAIPQLDGSTCAIAIPQLFKKCCFATATPQFRNRSFFLSPQLESFTSAIFGIFLAMESGFFMSKKIIVKKSRATVPFRHFLFPGKRTVLKLILVDF
jgi:hypothetical protein